MVKSAVVALLDASSSDKRVERPEALDICSPKVHSQRATAKVGAGSGKDKEHCQKVTELSTSRGEATPSLEKALRDMFTQLQGQL